MAVAYVVGIDKSWVDSTLPEVFGGSPNAVPSSKMWFLLSDCVDLSDGYFAKIRLKRPEGFSPMLLNIPKGIVLFAAEFSDNDSAVGFLGGSAKSRPAAVEHSD